MFTSRRSLLFGIIIALIAGLIVSVTSSPLPVVDLGYELHRATYNDSGQYYNFSNIRYAAPPIGNLRFSAPTKPTGRVTNDGSKAVTCIQASPAWIKATPAWLVNGTAAFNISDGYQPPNITTLPSVDYFASEDCLFLDLMVPKDIFNDAGHGEGAPVMVWIHGGGFTLGSKTLYSPSAAGLIKASQGNGSKGVIWIGLNYRLGLFGFLSGPTFQSNGTGNAGLHDQRFALDWVKQNIHKFGGDPNKVTLIGESAGGASILHQITAYGGLKGKVPFQQAIVQSPGFQMVPSATAQETVYEDFLTRAGVGTLQEARELSTEKLQLLNYQMVGGAYPYGTFTFNPTVDGDFVPALPGKLLLHGSYDTSLSIMTGHNLLEGLQFMDPFAQTEAAFEADLRVYFPTITSQAIAHISQNLYPPMFDGSYGYTTPTYRSEIMVTEAFFTCSTNYLARAYGKKTWNYFFTVPPSLHGDDIWYTYFNGPNPTVVKNDTLAIIMQKYFTNFGIHGNPNGAGLPKFGVYGENNTVLNLGINSIGPVPDNVGIERCLWWQKGLFA